MGFIDAFKGVFLHLSDNDKYVLEQIKDLEDYKEIDRLVRQRKASFVIKKFNLSMIQDDEYFELESQEQDLENFLLKVNEQIKKKCEEKLFTKFANRAYEVIPNCISPNLYGLDTVKQAILLQLFSTDNLHILLLGDSGLGKKELVRAGAELSPVSSFGLGSGTQKAGLSVVLSGKEVFKGLLPLADQGVCGIAELNLMRREDRAALYNAMEKGFISIDSTDGPLKFDARVKVLASANPAGGKFDRTLEKIKRQLPFDNALLQRFHLLFFIKSPDAITRSRIAKKTVTDKKLKLKKEDTDFIKDYIDSTKQIEVNLPKEFEDEITEFVSYLKGKEYKYLVEISPRLVIGLIRLAKASARCELRTQVEEIDLNRAKEILKESFRV